jgi:hypothetical protein
VTCYHEELGSLLDTNYHALLLLISLALHNRSRAFFYFSNIMPTQVTCLSPTHPLDGKEMMSH